MLHVAGTESKNTRLQLDPGEEMTPEHPGAKTMCTQNFMPFIPKLGLKLFDSWSLTADNLQEQHS